MTLAEEVRHTGRQVAEAPRADLANALNSALELYLNPPFKARSGCIADTDGGKSKAFATILFVPPSDISSTDPEVVAADAAAAIIDATESIDLVSFRSAYSRIAEAKRLRKNPNPAEQVKPKSTITLGIIFAQRSEEPLESFVKELERLNSETPSREWPDMIAVASTGVINYTVQFPGGSIVGDYLPPAENALANYTPAFYVVTVMKPTEAQTFNKMLSYLVAHLAFFAPEAKLPDFNKIQEGIPKTALTLTGYQYNLSGKLVPVPRQFYNDRLIPKLPLQIEDNKGRLMSTIEFLDWQDGGAILTKGDLPLIGLLPFLNIDKAAWKKVGVVRTPNDFEISHVLPIKIKDFTDMLNQFQRRSNMVVRQSKQKFLIQKVAEEGTASPFIARLQMGILHMRDVIYPDAKARDKFDSSFDLVWTALESARASAKEIIGIWTTHSAKVLSGEVVHLSSHAIRIDEYIDKDFRKQVEGFLNAGVRTIKQGMLDVTGELGVDIRFMFNKQGAFENGISKLNVTDPLLADYLRQTRIWSERLVEARNDVEHGGWTLPRVRYNEASGKVVAIEPEVSGQVVTAFVSNMLDRMCCFVEEITMHCIQKKMVKGTTLSEIPLANRLAEAPERFILTLQMGGLQKWDIAYHASLLEQT